MKQVFMIVCDAGLCVFLAGSMCDMFVKPTVARWRPGHDPEIAMYVDAVNGYRSGNYGFFSSHASNTFSIAVFFSLLVRSRLLTFFLVLWSLVNCWTRMYLGVHFPGDILCGLLWGGLVGSLVYYFFLRVERRFDNGMRFVSSQYTATGYQCDDVDVVVTVLVFTLFYALFRACFMLYV